ncbi:MAG: hypothetical protein M0Z33_02150 [Actinomycetota bacterium]|nr:hypothetical protein [Actinomycetota bacterium]
MTATTITGALVAAIITAIAVLSGTGHAIPGVLTTLAGGLVAGHFAIAIPGLGTVTVQTTSASAPTAATAPTAHVVGQSSAAAPPVASTSLTAPLAASAPAPIVSP